MEMRGQLYSLIAVMIVVPMVLFIAFFLSSSQDFGIGVSDKIIADQQSHLVRSVEGDLERALAISGRRALLAASNHVISDGVPLNDSEAALTELIIDGTLMGNESFMMSGNTMEDWKSSVLGVQTGFSLDADYSGVSVAGQSGFGVNLSAGLTVNVSDSLGISRIDRSFQKRTHSSALGLEDPLYSLNTEGFIKRLISAYPYSYYAMEIVSGDSYGNCSGNVTFDSGNPDSEKILVTGNASGVSGFLGVVSETSDLPSVSCYMVSASGAVSLINSTIEESGYREIYLDEATSAAWSIPLVDGVLNGCYYNEDGPGIMERLENSMDEVSGGMESFVSIPDLQAQGIPITTGKSLVDYLYFSEQNYNGTGVRGFPDWFRIDPSHAAIYNITELMES